MDEDKIAENAQFLIEVGFELNQAWKLAYLMAKPEKERTDEENELIKQALKQINNDTFMLKQGYPYVEKLLSELHTQNWLNGIIFGVEDDQRKKYKEVGSPHGDTEEGFAKWQTELHNLNRMQERLQQMLKNI